MTEADIYARLGALAGGNVFPFVAPQAQQPRGWFSFCPRLPAKMFYADRQKLPARFRWMPGPVRLTTPARCASRLNQLLLICILLV